MSEAMRPLDLITQIECDLNGAFAERRAEIRALLLGALTGRHVLLLGPPGTAKSALANAVFEALWQGAPTFTRLLMKSSTPEEVFGPLDLKALEQGRYERLTAGYLPESTAAFLDEVFKCNSAVLNSLLTILNERLFDNGAQRVRVPLRFVVGASNELPEEGLEALDDRFLLRFWVKPIVQATAFAALIDGAAKGSLRFQTAVKLDAATFAAAQAEIAAVLVDPATIEAMGKIREALQRESIYASDRKFVQATALVQGAAWFAGKSTAQPNDLAVLADALWQTPEQASTVRRIVLENADPGLKTAQEVFDGIAQTVRDFDFAALRRNPSAHIANAGALLSAVKDAVRQLGELPQTPGVVQIAADARELQQKLGAAMADASNALRV